MDRADQLQAFVQAVEGKPVEWGRDDCTAWCAAWIREATGKEVPFLGSYDSLDQAHELIDAAGGLDALWSQALARVGMYSTPYVNDTQLGDIGIVNTSRFGPVGVIFSDDGIALWRADNGTALLRPRRRDIFKVWELPN